MRRTLRDNRVGCALRLWLGVLALAASGFTKPGGHRNDYSVRIKVIKRASDAHRTDKKKQEDGPTLIEGVGPTADTKVPEWMKTIRSAMAFHQFAVDKVTKHGDVLRIEARSFFGEEWREFVYRPKGADHKKLGPDATDALSALYDFLEQGQAVHVIHAK